MSSEKTSGGGLLHDYIIALVGPYGYIGRLHDEVDDWHLEPAFEARVKYMFSRDGQFSVVRECTPIMGSTTIRRVELAGDVDQIFYCRDMNGRERESWAAAMEEADMLIKAMRAAETGIVTAPALPANLPPPEAVHDPLGLLRK